MNVRPDLRIGRNAMLLTLMGQENLDPEFIKDLRFQGYIFCQGKTGSI